MSRFWIATAPAAGHVHPAVPLARELATRGHEVLWSTGEYYRKTVESSGATWLPTDSSSDPRDRDLYEWLEGLGDRKGLEQIKWYIKHMFCDAVPGQFAVYERFAREVPPDAVIADSVSYGALFFAEKRRIPSCLLSVLPLSIPSRDTVPFGLGIPPGTGLVSRIRIGILNAVVLRFLLHDVDRYLNQTRRIVGLPPLGRPAFRTFYRVPDTILQVTVPDFEYPRTDLPSHVRFVGPMLPRLSRPSELPVWWNDLRTPRPIVLVTQGTVAKDPSKLILPLIEALAGEDMLVIAVPLSRGRYPDLPRNVRAEDFVPFDALLPFVHAMVTNGGYGGVQFALAHGIPVVCAGETEDKLEVGGRVEWARVGINLKKETPPQETLRKAVFEVLRNPAFKRNAQRMGAGMARYDAPKMASDLIEELACRRRER